jgi:hypothetical protein
MASSSIEGIDITVAKREIKVGDTECTKEYEPVCGQIRIVCITTPCNPIQQTYANKCMMKAAGAEKLYDGACKDRANKPPVIREFSAPTTLKVNESGTWKVSASDPENGQLSYRIDWGDSWLPQAVAGALRMYTDAFVQDTSFTHSYSHDGTYTVIVYVKDDAGNMAKASASVRVGEKIVACTLQYDPVCGQPAEPACRYSIPACMMATPGPRTYGNTCLLDAEGATFLYKGECKNDMPVACTQEAKRCSDGTWVGRTGPKCQFVCASATLDE